MPVKSIITPGPWIYESNTGGGFDILEKRILRKGFHGSLAHVMGDTHEADAKLIAAAPELLAACKEVLQWCTAEGKYKNGKDTIQRLAEEIVPMLDKVILKATL